MNMDSVCRTNRHDSFYNMDWMILDMIYKAFLMICEASLIFVLKSKFFRFLEDKNCSDSVST